MAMISKRSLFLAGGAAGFAAVLPSRVVEVMKKKQQHGWAYIRS